MSMLGITVSWRGTTLSWQKATRARDPEPEGEECRAPACHCLGPCCQQRFVQGTVPTGWKDRNGDTWTVRPPGRYARQQGKEEGS